MHFTAIFIQTIGGVVRGGGITSEEGDARGTCPTPYKVIREISIGAKMYDLKWSLSDIKVFFVADRGITTYST